MPLYAFDGTWNTDKPGADRDTNVLWFRQAYEGPAVYWPGVGTRFNLLGRVAGGITGAGGRARVEEAFEQLAGNLEAGETTIDIVGFSRGAALALHFANMVESHPASPSIRFLGLWDCVPSFGAPSIDLNIGWDLRLPDNVEKCYHAMALDERRHTFHLHRPDARVADADQEGRLFEVWFRGVHSDVGGGNANEGLSSVALNWMLRKAKSCGLPIRSNVVDQNVVRMKPGCPISEGQWYDVVKNRWRVVRWNDQVHTSVAFSTDRNCNNPPVGLARVDDDGTVVGRFANA
jgi:uncharacterized protein (DUF2235 family)